MVSGIRSQPGFSGYLAGELSGFRSQLWFSGYLAGELSSFQSRLRFSAYLAGELSGFWSRLRFSGYPWLVSFRGGLGSSFPVIWLVNYPASGPGSRFPVTYLAGELSGFWSRLRFSSYPVGELPRFGSSSSFPVIWPMRFLRLLVLAQVFRLSGHVLSASGPGSSFLVIWPVSYPLPVSDPVFRPAAQRHALF